MRKILCVVILLPLLAAGCNAENKNSDTINSEVKPQTYQGQGFSTQYPSDWLVRQTSYPSKDPSSCGNAFSNADYCVQFTPNTDSIDGAGISLNVFKSNKSLLDWCLESIYAYQDCESTDITGLGEVYITTTNPPTDTPRTEARILGKNGQIISIIGNVEHKSVIDEMAHYVSFAN